MNALLATHGRPDLLKETLESLLSSSPAILSKIVVVENGGDFGSREIVERCNRDGRLIFTSISKANKSLALNAGVELCDDGLIFLTDDDVIIQPDTLVAYQVASSIHGPGNYYGGRMEARYQSAPPDWLLPYLPSSARCWPTGDRPEGDYWFCTGCNWAAYRQDLIAAGGFDAEFGPGSATGSTGQESNMQRRLRADFGVRGVFVPDAVVSHQVPPEHCSPEWAVKRAHRSGIEKGMCSAQKNRDAALKVVWKRRLRGLLRRVLAKLSGNWERRFHADFWDSNDSGYHKGVERILSGKH